MKKTMIEKQNESYISYNPTSVTDRKANGVYSTDKDATINPVARTRYPALTKTQSSLFVVLILVRYSVLSIESPQHAR